MEPDIINSAMDSKYTEFSKSVNDVLKTKLSSHASVVEYSAEYDKIKEMKSTFQKISNPEE